MSTKSLMISVFILLSTINLVYCEPMRLFNQKWARQYSHSSYNRKLDPNKLDSEEDYQTEVLKDNYGYSGQGMKDLDEVGALTGGGNSEILSVLRPYYTVMDMSANGNKQGIGSYINVLPDEEFGDKPIYTLGGSFSGGLEPAGVKMGNIARSYGK
uniref:Peptidase A1 domain-containing protein n=1 Tax=Rhabditophanes sp. KR3021 TaxID=114890 RepID=A0AC35UGV5_9BILA